MPGGDEVTPRQTATSLGAAGAGGPRGAAALPEARWERGDLLCKCAVPSCVALAWDDAVKSCAAFVDKH